MKKTILNISSKLLDRQVDFFKKLMSRLNGAGGGIPTIIKEDIGYDKTTNVFNSTFGNVHQWRWGLPIVKHEVLPHHNRRHGKD